MQMVCAAHSKHIVTYAACLSSNLLSLSWWLMTWNTQVSRSGSKTTRNPTEKTSSVSTACPLELPVAGLEPCWVFLLL